MTHSTTINTFVPRRISRQAAHQIRISAFIQIVEFVLCQKAGLMAIQAPHTFDARLCLMTDRSVVNIVPGKHFYVYIANLTAEAVHLRKFMTDAFTTNAAAGNRVAACT